jgi:hypothetical protein
MDSGPLEHLPAVTVRVTPGRCLDLHPPGVLARAIRLVG